MLVEPDNSRRSTKLHQKSLVLIEKLNRVREPLASCMVHMPKRILIVEDDPISRKYVGVFLRQEGYEVNEAKDGAEALDLLDSFQFDLVLSDIRMPRVDGLRSSRTYARSPQTPLLLYLLLILTMRERLVADLGIPRESLVNRNVHVEADQEHALLLEKVLRRHVKSPAIQDVVVEALRKTLVIDRAYRAGLAFAMNQIPL